LPRAHRSRRRLQAGRRHSERQDSPAVAHSDERGAGRPLAQGRSVPTRRVEPAHRHRAAARAFRDRALLRRAPAPDGMTTVSEIFETMAYGPAPESDKEALAWIARHGGEFGLFIGGGWTNGKGGELFDVINPATAKRLARVTQAGPADVDAAVAAARQGLGSWSSLSGHARARHLYAVARAVQQHARLLAAHGDVDKIAFTGSTEVGRIIRQATAGSGKKLSLELGGKSPFLVFDDADLDSVVEGVVDAIWFNQGQVCCAGSRLLAHEG